MPGAKINFSNVTCLSSIPYRNATATAVCLFFFYSVLGVYAEPLRIEESLIVVQFQPYSELMEQLRFLEKFHNEADRVEALLRLLSLYTDIDYLELRYYMLVISKGQNQEPLLRHILIQVLTKEGALEDFQTLVVRSTALQRQHALFISAILVGLPVMILMALLNR